MESKYLEFEEVHKVPSTKKTKDFRVWNKTKDQCIGWINWYGPWRRYVFTSPEGQTIYDFSCLTDIAKFIDGLMTERANKLIELIKNS